MYVRDNCSIKRLSRSLADFAYQRSDEEVVHLLGEP